MAFCQVYDPHQDSSLSTNQTLTMFRNVLIRDLAFFRSYDGDIQLLNALDNRACCFSEVLATLTPSGRNRLWLSVHAEMANKLRL